MNVQIEESWKQHLAPEFEKDYFIRLTEFVRSEYPRLPLFTHRADLYSTPSICARLTK